MLTGEIAMPKDYYVVLGISKNADLKKIKKAYRTAVKKHHPDVLSGNGSKEKFLEAKQAYEILSNENSRRMYDRKRESQKSGMKRSRPAEPIRQRPSGYNERGFFAAAAENLLEGCLPGLPSGFVDNGKYNGAELFLELILTAREAAEGGVFSIPVPVIAPCPQCRTRGCRGYFFCPVCRGKGRVKIEQDFTVSLPSHIKHGTHLRLPLDAIGFESIFLNVIVVVDHYNEM